MKNRMLRMLVIAGATLICAWPQDGLVVELTKEESAKAAELYRRYASAQSDWEKFREAIRNKYGPAQNRVVPEERLAQIQLRPGDPTSETVMPRDWLDGPNFSPDFRFAVPRKKQ